MTENEHVRIERSFARRQPKPTQPRRPRRPHQRLEDRPQRLDHPGYEAERSQWRTLVERRARPQTGDAL